MVIRFLLVLPALVYARINVEVSGNFENEKPEINVQYSGNQMDIISDLERGSFGLRDNKLKNAVKTYFGKRPDDVFLRSPTPWGDLYRTYNWDQVTRTLVPKSAKVLKITSEPSIVMMQVFENNSFKPITVNVGLIHSVENRVSSHWTKRGTLSTGQISYGIDIEFPNLGGSRTFSYTSAWGVNAAKYDIVKVGAMSPMEVILQPGQSVTAGLHVTMGFIQIEMEYMASVSGSVAASYNNKYKGQYFWALPVRNLISNGGLRNDILSREVIEISFYSQSKVVVCDRRNRTLMEMDF